MVKRARKNDQNLVRGSGRCVVHRWVYQNVDGMKMKFRVCERCDALEAKPDLPFPGLKWRQYSPTGGMGFVEALRMRAEKGSLAERNGIPLETVDTDAAPEEAGESVRAEESDK